MVKNQLSIVASHMGKIRNSIKEVVKVLEHHKQNNNLTADSYRALSSRLDHLTTLFTQKNKRILHRYNRQSRQLNKLIGKYKSLKYETVQKSQNNHV